MLRHNVFELTVAGVSQGSWEGGGKSRARTTGEPAPAPTVASFMRMTLRFDQTYGFLVIASNLRNTCFLALPYFL